MNDKKRSSTVYGVVGLFLIAMLIGGFFFLRNISRRTTEDRMIPGEDTNILIQDELGVIGDDYDELMDALELFQRETGITPAVFISAGTWEEVKEDGEDVGYFMLNVPLDSYYNENFNDGKHVAFVFFRGSLMGREDWGMQVVRGAETGPYFSDSEKTYLRGEFFMAQDASENASPAVNFATAIHSMYGEATNPDTVKNNTLVAVIIVAVIALLFGPLVFGSELLHKPDNYDVRVDTRKWVNLVLRERIYADND